VAEPTTHAGENAPFSNPPSTITSGEPEFVFVDVYGNNAVVVPRHTTGIGPTTIVGSGFTVIVKVIGGPKQVVPPEV
jgi:hypothetical protein